MCMVSLKVQGNIKALVNCESSKCSACEFGKGFIQPDRKETINYNPIKEQELNKYNNIPGQMLYMVKLTCNLVKLTCRLY